MFANEIPDFIVDVMEHIEIGIDRVADKKLTVVEPPAGVDPPMVKVKYPEHVELLLNIDAKIDDGTAEGAFESQSLWVKIPWPTRVA